jgi:uncharacterized protein (TIGR03792 family)
MVIEWLRFEVPPNLREVFVQTDEDIWSAALAGYPGYLGKEVWINPELPYEVVLVIRWASKQAWDAVPIDYLNQVEAKFSSQMNGSYKLVESRMYHQRKFPRITSEQ